MPTGLGHSNVTVTGAVKGSRGALASVVLTAGIDAASVVLDDSADGSGAKLCTLKAAANTTAVWTPAMPQAFSLLYATVTGTTPEITIQYL
jgi:hypothetical protein